MLGERLAELRKLNDDTQQTLADKLGISVWSIRAWEQGKSYPFSNVLLAICKLYGTSADYLLGLTDIDPSDEVRKQRQRLTEEEQKRDAPLRRIFALETQKNKPPSETVRSLGGCFCYMLYFTCGMFSKLQNNVLFYTYPFY